MLFASPTPSASQSRVACILFADVTPSVGPGGGASAGGGADAGAGDAKKGPGAGHAGGPAGAGEGRSASFEGEKLGLSRF
jgi:hypothetical protein